MIFNDMNVADREAVRINMLVIHILYNSSI